MIKDLEEYIIDNWEEIAGGREKPNTLSFLLRSGNTTLQMYIFSNKLKNPIYIAKFCRNKESEHLIEREFQNMKYIYNASDVLKSALSEPLFLEEISGNLLLIQSALPGKSIPDVVNLRGSFLYRKKFFKYFSLVEEWLHKFQHQTQVSEFILTEEKVKEHFLTPIVEFSKRNLLTDTEKRFFCEFDKKALASLGCKIPLGFAHNDFWAGNILIDRNKIYVIDWADFEKANLPFWDFLLFLSTFTFSSISSYNEDIIKEYLKHTYIDDNWFSQLVNRILKKYLSRMNLEYDIIKTLFPVFLVRRTLREQNMGCNVAKQYWRELVTYYIEHERYFFKNNS